MSSVTLERAIEIEARHGAPTLASIPLSRLRLVASYQRTLDPARVRKMIAGWRQPAMGVVYVSEREPDDYVVIDGQHRCAACRAVYGPGVDPLIPCLVYRGLSVPEEAEMFVFYNGNQYRRSPSVHDVFNAELVAGNPDAHGIVRVVTAVGMSIRSGPQDGTIQALAALRMIWRLGGEQRLRDVLYILHAAYGKDRAAYQSGMLRGIDVFLERYSADAAFIRSRLIEVLRRTDTSMILRRVQAISPPRVHSSITSVYGRVVLECYNRGLRRGQLPEWADPTSRASAVMVGRGARMEGHGERVRGGMDAQKRMAAVQDEEVD